MNNMANYISDEIKILVLYIIKDLEIEDIKKIIWENIFCEEQLSLEWLEEMHDLSLYYSDSYYSDNNSYYSDGYYID